MAGHIVAYVSGHGFGHAAREIEILRHLPPDIRLTVKTASAKWFWRENMGRRAFDFFADAFDVGCVQKDSIRIDVPATLEAFETMEARNRDRFAAEADDLRRLGATLVVSDVASFPIMVAAHVGIPAILIVNFTWADIYAGFVAEEPRFAPHVARLTDEYRQATLALDTDLSLPMPYVKKEEVGLVARPGASRRDELRAHLPPEARDKHLALVYLGGWGYPLPYEQLERFTNWHFLALQAPPVPVTNWTTFPRDLVEHTSLVASVDLVVSKPGYGITGECLSQGTPLLYCPRPAFAEYPALHTALSAWPGGLLLSEDDFLSLRWQEILNAVPKRDTLPRRPAPGGPRAARILADWATASRD